MPRTSIDVSQLVSQAVQDRAAFEELVHQYRGFVLSLARPRCLDAHSAEDICQDVWVIVEKELPKLRETKAFLGWLAKITEHATTAYLKRRARERDLDKDAGEVAVEVEQAPPDAVSLMEEKHDAVLRALRSLPEEYRVPVTMRFYQGLTAREIGEALNCPIGTILSRLFRANAMLKERLQRYL